MSRNSTDEIGALESAVEALLPLLEGRERTRVAGAPEGHDARLVAALAERARRPVLHVVGERGRMDRLRKALSFFAPEAEVLALPEWDCLPYDRLPPSSHVTAHRVEVLARLANGPAHGPRIVLATVAAFLQRLPPRSGVAEALFRARSGDEVTPATVREALLRAGYVETDAPGDFGEFALADDVVDFHPPGEERPQRILFGGGRLKGVRAYEPYSGEEGPTRENLAILPTAEVWLDEASVQRFQARYLERFGSEAADDPLYRAVTAGRRHAAMEHWLPLFHDDMETLLDYLPEAAVILDAEAEKRRDARIEQVEDAYAGRLSMIEVQESAHLPPYRPVPPEMLFMDAGTWKAGLAAGPVLDLLPRRPAKGQNAIDAGGRRLPPPPKVENGALAEWLAGLRRQGQRVVVSVPASGRAGAAARRLRREGVKPTALARDWGQVRDLAEEGTAVAPLDVREGVWSRDLAIVPASILQPAPRRPRRRRRLAPFTGLEGPGIGEVVVHEDHGFGLCDGLETVETDGAPHDYVVLMFKRGGKLYVPVEGVDQLWRYGPTDGRKVPLDTLGGDSWPRRRQRVNDGLVPTVRSLVRQAVERESRKVAPLRPPVAYEAFADRFPHQLTEDQRRATDDVLADLASGHLMDRLVCGDVGFGKTEVALRAAFVAAMNGRQVAVVVPTTPLCRQHYDNFRRRFRGFGLPMAQLSRSVPPHEARKVKRMLAESRLRLVVGTHALLASDVAFADLGLLVVDEEQRLGVAQKDRLRQLSSNVHVLTMTATPIPRTLQMALSGLRDLSLIATAPVARKPVRSIVLQDDAARIRDALMRECDRGGQSFYVCPRLEDLGPLRARLAETVPDLRVVEAHGKLPPAQLDDVMCGFADGAYDLLLSTNIIEAGLDIPNANTLVVHRSDMFGLAQLHQLRGRVGRSARRGYAYFACDPDKPLTAEARQRLEVLAAVTEPGGGFALASRDMDIRGSGNLMGEEQSGHMREVGAELFQHMLSNAVAAVRQGAEEPPPSWVPKLKLNVPVLIPAGYISDPALRLGIYSRIARMEGEGEVDDIADELESRFGPLPDEVETVLAVGEIKRLCRDIGVEELDVGPKGAVLVFRGGLPPAQCPLGRALQWRGDISIRPDGRVVHANDWSDAEARLGGARRLLEALHRAKGD